MLVVDGGGNKEDNSKMATTIYGQQRCHNNVTINLSGKNERCQLT